MSYLKAKSMRYGRRGRICGHQAEATRVAIERRLDAPEAYKILSQTDYHGEITPQEVIPHEAVPESFVNPVLGMRTVQSFFGASNSSELGSRIFRSAAHQPGLGVSDVAFSNNIG